MQEIINRLERTQLEKINGICYWNTSKAKNTNGVFMDMKDIYLGGIRYWDPVMSRI